jgi:hypothetical protein
MTLNHASLQASVKQAIEGVLQKRNQDRELKNAATG